ncbi:MAG TPA: RNA methyltransferase, partial [Oceanospirillales bacterium]|nr:RNA methyltransferase [Oceanospirillales bacterium]
MKFDDARKLNQKKYRTLHRHFLVEGEHLLQELEKAALTQPRLKQSTVFVTERFAGVATSLPVQVISEKQMKQISGTQT